MIGQEIFVAKLSGTDTNEVTPADTLGLYAVADIAAVGDNVLLRWTGSSSDTCFDKWWWNPELLQVLVA